MRSPLSALAVVIMMMTGTAEAASVAWVDRCHDVAVGDLRAQAESQKLHLEEETVAVDQIDDRWYNPAKYVWFKAQATKADGTRQQLVVMKQKSGAGCGGAPAFKANPKYVEECRVGAIPQLSARLASSGATIDLATVKVDEVDDRRYSPWKYVWVVALGHTPGGSVETASVLMQKSFLPPKECGTHPKSRSSPGPVTRSSASK